MTDLYHVPPTRFNLSGSWLSLQLGSVHTVKKVTHEPTNISTQTVNKRNAQAVYPGKPLVGLASPLFPYRFLVFTRLVSGLVMSLHRLFACRTSYAIYILHIYIYIYIYYICYSPIHNLTGFKAGTFCPGNY